MTTPSLLFMMAEGNDKMEGVVELTAPPIFITDELIKQVSDYLDVFPNALPREILHALQSISYGEGASLYGKRFFFLGRENYIEWKILRIIIWAYGGVVVLQIDKTTDFIITGSKASQKQLDLYSPLYAVIDEEQLLDLFHRRGAAFHEKLMVMWREKKYLELRKKIQDRIDTRETYHPPPTRDQEAQRLLKLEQQKEKKGLVEAAKQLRLDIKEYEAASKKERSNDQQNTTHDESSWRNPNVNRFQPPPISSTVSRDEARAMDKDIGMDWKARMAELDKPKADEKRIKSALYMADVQYHAKTLEQYLFRKAAQDKRTEARTYARNDVFLKRYGDSILSLVAKFERERGVHINLSDPNGRWVEEFCEFLAEQPDDVKAWFHIEEDEDFDPRNHAPSTYVPPQDLPEGSVEKFQQQMVEQRITDAEKVIADWKKKEEKAEKDAVKKAKKKAEEAKKAEVQRLKDAGKTKTAEAMGKDNGKATESESHEEGDQIVWAEHMVVDQDPNYVAPDAAAKGKGKAMEAEEENDNDTPMHDVTGNAPPILEEEALWKDDWESDDDVPLPFLWERRWNVIPSLKKSKVIELDGDAATQDSEEMTEDVGSLTLNRGTKRKIDLVEDVATQDSTDMTDNGSRTLNRTKKPRLELPTSEWKDLDWSMGWGEKYSRKPPNTPDLSPDSSEDEDDLIMNNRPAHPFTMRATKSIPLPLKGKYEVMKKAAADAGYETFLGRIEKPMNRKDRATRSALKGAREGWAQKYYKDLEEVAAGSDDDSAEVVDVDGSLTNPDLLNQVYRAMRKAMRAVGYKLRIYHRTKVPAAYQQLDVRDLLCRTCGGGASSIQQYGQPSASTSMVAFKKKPPVYAGQSTGVYINELYSRDVGLETSLAWREFFGPRDMVLVNHHRSRQPVPPAKPGSVGLSWSYKQIDYVPQALPVTQPQPSRARRVLPLPCSSRARRIEAPPQSTITMQPSSDIGASSPRTIVNTEDNNRNRPSASQSLFMMPSASIASASSPRIVVNTEAYIHASALNLSSSFTMSSTLAAGASSPPTVVDAAVNNRGLLSAELTPAEQARKEQREREDREQTLKTQQELNDDKESADFDGSDDDDDDTMAQDSDEVESSQAVDAVEEPQNAQDAQDAQDIVDVAATGTTEVNETVEAVEAVGNVNDGEEVDVVMNDEQATQNEEGVSSTGAIETNEAVGIIEAVENTNDDEVDQIMKDVQEVQEVQVARDVALTATNEANEAAGAVEAVEAVGNINSTQAVEGAEAVANTEEVEAEINSPPYISTTHSSPQKQKKVLKTYSRKTES